MSFAVAVGESVRNKLVVGERARVCSTAGWNLCRLVTYREYWRRAACSNVVKPEPGCVVDAEFSLENSGEFGEPEQDGSASNWLLERGA